MPLSGFPLNGVAGSVLSLSSMSPFSLPFSKGNASRFTVTLPPLASAPLQPFVFVLVTSFPFLFVPVVVHSAPQFTASCRYVLGMMANVSSAHWTSLKLMRTDFCSCSGVRAVRSVGLSASVPSMRDHTVTRSSGHVYVSFLTTAFAVSDSLGWPALWLTYSSWLVAVSRNTENVPPAQLNCTASGPIFGISGWSKSKTRIVAWSILTASSVSVCLKQVSTLRNLLWHRLSSSKSDVSTFADFRPLYR